MDQLKTQAAYSTSQEVQQELSKSADPIQYKFTTRIPDPCGRLAIWIREHQGIWKCLRVRKAHLRMTQTRSAIMSCKAESGPRCKVEREDHVKDNLHSDSEIVPESRGERIR